MDNKVDYGNIFCQAVDTILSERLSKLSYDSTILCTIINDSKKEEGEYEVQNGQAKFKAYSLNTKYSKNNSVYVQIPKGDWNEQKFIIGKKSDNEEQPLTYSMPFTQYVDITGNLIENTDVKEGFLDNNNIIKAGLLANAPSTESYKNEVLIWEWIANTTDKLPLIDYTRLGIQAQFQSWLEEECWKGNYGLRLEITCERAETTGSDETSAAADHFSIYLTEKDMYGNPYHFQTYYQQEIVVDISNIHKITGLQLYFYEAPDTFFLSDGSSLPYKDFLNNYLVPNLFIKDPYVSVGYDVNEFDEEMLIIYTPGNSTYSAIEDSKYNNKEIQVRWIHEKEDGSFECVNNINELEYTLKFYRYELGRGSADELSGVYWKELSTHIHGYDKDNKEQIFKNIPLDEDFIQYLSDNNIYKINNDGTVEIDKYTTESDWAFKTWLIPDITVQTEQVKAILTYNSKVYRSKILTFTSNKEVPSKPTIDAINALTINCEDGSYGNYRIYNLGNSLIDQAQGSLTRQLKAYFNSALTGADNEEEFGTLLIEAESVEWIVPSEKTMIVIDGDYSIDPADKCYHIKTSVGAGFPLNYRINSYYSQDKSNNTIQLKITKQATNYTASKELTFGVAGTTGTDHTLVIDFDKNVTALTVGDTSAVTLTARLYNYQNEEIELYSEDEGEKIAVKWSWKTPQTQITLNNNLEKSNQVEIKLNTANPDLTANYAILQATIEKWDEAKNTKGWGDYDLIAYLPIPIRSSTAYRHISGPTQVIYNSDGLVDAYFQDPYTIHLDDGTDVSGIWEISNGTTNESDSYTPGLNNYKGVYTLNPISVYVENTCQNICIYGKIDNEIVWSQPILIMKNRWPSSTLNEWDGSLTIDTDKNTIMSAKMAAGRKEDNNTFTGVILGDWTDSETEEDYVGLFGYDFGEMAYAFRNDGTAFIGKDGTGRIVFNGDSGIIQSALFNDGVGMSLDLKNGTIEAHDFLLDVGEVEEDNSIRITTDLDDYPLQIGSLFYVEWDGTLHATNGNFTGYIDATSGTISGDLTVSGSLTGGEIIGSTISGGIIIGSEICVPNETNPTFHVSSIGILTASDAYITGDIVANTLIAIEEGQIGPWTFNSTQFKYESLGYVGPTAQNITDVGQTDNYSGVGMYTDNSVIKVTGDHAGMKWFSDANHTTQSYIYCDKNGVHLAGTNGVSLGTSNTMVNVLGELTADKDVTLKSTLDVTGKSTLVDLEVTGTTTGVHATLV